MDTKLTSGKADSIPQMTKAADAAMRKQILQTLIGALQGLQPGGEQDVKDDVTPSEIERVLTKQETAVEEKIGADAFENFEGKLKGLVRELRRLSNASRDLASSVDVVRSSNNLCQSLTLLRAVLRGNAADLFPRIERVMTSSEEEMQETERLTVEADLKKLPNLFGSLSRDSSLLLNRLNAFIDFKDEAVNNSMSVLGDELSYLSRHLLAYEGQSKNKGFKTYIHNRTDKLGERMEDVGLALSTFVDAGIQAVRYAQNQSATTFLTLTTVATFFSAVTATTLQYSFDATVGPLQVTVNSFWFCSLVFSVASVLNGLLGYMLAHARYRSPVKYAPRWVSLWIKHTPLAFLIISAAAFSLGLCVFAYSSKQGLVTSTLTTVFTAISSVGHVAVTVWFILERWSFEQYQGQTLLKDTIDNWVPWKSTVAWISRTPISRLRKMVTRRPKARSLRLPEPATSGRRSTDVQTKENLDEARYSGVTSYRRPSLPAVTADPLTVPAMGPPIAIPQHSDEKPGRSVSGLDGGISDSRGDPEGDFRSVTAAASSLQRFWRLMNVGLLNRQIKRVGNSLSMVQAMAPSVELHSHTSIVRHMQFSPDGQYLATCSWDKTAVIYRTSDFNDRRILEHETELPSYLAWSSAGDLLITKTLRGMKLWASDGTLKAKIDRGRVVDSVTWFPHGEALLSVESGKARKLDLKGDVMDRYSMQNATIQDVAFTKDSTRMVCVAFIEHGSDDFIHAVHDREETIIVYNLTTKSIEHRVPVLGEPRSMKLSQDGKMVLISYENKSAPQRWKLEYQTQKDGSGKDVETVQLVLEQTYMPRRPVDFAGPSHFGGKLDQLVVSAGKNGTVYVWDKSTAFLLHQYQDLGDVTCLTWNHAASPFMFCTGSHNGTVRVWTPTECARFARTASSIGHDRMSSEHVDASRTSSPFSSHRMHSKTGLLTDYDAQQMPYEHERAIEEEP